MRDLAVAGVVHNNMWDGTLVSNGTTIFLLGFEHSTPAVGVNKTALLQHTQEEVAAGGWVADGGRGG